MKWFVSLALVCLVVGVEAQPVSLTDEQIESAVAAGSKAKGKHHGLVLRDSAQSFAAALGSTGDGVTASSGFWLEAYTPLSWIQQQAAAAAKEYRTMSTQDVGAELREPVFRVVVHPDTPNTVTSRGMSGTTSVQHVVLRDESRRVVVQPTWKEAFEQEVKNAMGATITFGGLNAKFSMDDLREIRGPRGDGEFFITVIGSSGEEKNFKVKRKHFDELK